MEGFGEKSYENLMAAVKKASHTNLVRVVYGIGVAGIGLANAKMLCRAFGYDFERMRHATAEELTAVDGIGDVLADAWIDYLLQRRTARRWMGFWQSLPLRTRQRTPKQPSLPE